MGNLDKLSIFISLVLRHKPDAANIILDEHGWANVEELLNGINNTAARSVNECVECKKKYIMCGWWIGFASPSVVYG